MIEPKITILTDLDPAGPRTHVRIYMPNPMDDYLRAKIQQMVRAEIARILVRRTIGL